MAIDQLFAGVAVADYGAALAWYERLFGRPPDVIGAENEAMWQVAATGWVYVVGDAERAGRALITLMTDDLAGHVAALAARGLVAGASETYPGGARKVTFADPEGNLIAFAEVTGGD